MSEQIKDGGPAFPLKDPAMGDAQGMTLRDYFATKQVIADGEMTLLLAKALMGSSIPESDGSPTQTINIYRWWAEAESRYKFLYADAMLAAREAKS